MKKLFQILRSLLSIVGGILIISLITEFVEFGIVAAVHGSVVTDQAIYFEIRNRLPILLLKFVYNSLAALAGGYAAAWIAGRSETSHGIGVAVIQTLSLLWGMTASPFASTTPLWVWITLLVVTPIAIIAGAKWRENGIRRRTTQ